MRLTACGLLWCSLRSAIGAANLQDHSESWAAAGLVDQLVQARADAMRAGLGFGWLVEEGSKGAAAGRPVAAGSAVRQTNPTCGRPTLYALRQAYVDVLPAALFEAVQREAAAVAGESAKGDAFKFGKRTTWWLPLRAKDGARIPPRSAIEAAVHELHRQATRSPALALSLALTLTLTHTLTLTIDLYLVSSLSSLSFLCYLLPHFPRRHI